MPRIGSDRLRVLLLFIALGGHEALAKLMYAGYASVAGVSAAQLHLGAGIMYYGRDLVDVVIVFVFCRRWYVRSARRLRRRQHLCKAEEGGTAITERALTA